MHVLAFNGSLKEEIACLAAYIGSEPPRLPHREGFMADSQDSKDLEVLLQPKNAFAGNGIVVRNDWFPLRTLLGSRIKYTLPHLGTAEGTH